MAATDGVDPGTLDSRRGWLLVALSVLALLILWGSVFTFTVYAEALASAFGLTSIQASAVFSIGTAAFFVAGGLVGIIVARLPLQPVVLAAGVAVVLAVAAFQVVDSFGTLAAAFALFGVAGGTAFVVIISLIPQ